MARNRLARDWVPMVQYGTQQTIVANGASNLVLVAPRDVTLTLGGPAPTEVGVVETENEVATTRVIGQVAIRSDVDEPPVSALCIERIRVGIFDNAGAEAFFANSFIDPEDANEPFLWQRVQTVSSLGNMNANVSHPWWSVIDVRVGRRLRQDQALFYSVTWVAPIGSPDLLVRPFLRTLARLA